MECEDGFIKAPLEWRRFQLAAVTGNGVLISHLKTRDGFSECTALLSAGGRIGVTQVCFATRFRAD